LSVRPLRIALFTGNFGYTRDGATQALSRLVSHLRHVEGADVRIYSPTSPGADVPQGLVPIPSIALPGRREYRLGLGLTGQVRKDILAFAPDVIHLATPDLVGFQAQRLGRQLGRPLIASLHTRFETYLTYYGLGFLEPVLERRLLDFYGRCDCVLAPTPGIAQDLSRSGLRGRVRIWSRGVDRTQFDPARRDLHWRRAHGFADSDFVVLFFGRLVLEKGLAVFADAFDRLREGRRDVRTLVVGDGPARAWMAQRLPRATFTGFLTGAELGRAVASADALLNPSNTEAFGNVNLEAMASGLPIVSADLPSSRFLIKDEQTGLLCAAGEPQAYAEALHRLLVRPAWRARLGAAAHAASRAYSWEAALTSVAEAYRDALRTHATPLVLARPRPRVPALVRGA
jgi:phosphatidylinositol alpha 1,6-mannosyltransferase